MVGRSKALEPKLTTAKAAVKCPSRVEMSQIPGCTQTKANAAGSRLAQYQGQPLGIREDEQVMDSLVSVLQHLCDAQT